jgi:putative ABC transport system ATP-binding protein
MPESEPQERRRWFRRSERGRAISPDDPAPPDETLDEPQAAMEEAVETAEPPIEPLENVLWDPLEIEPAGPSGPDEEPEASVPESVADAPRPRGRLRIGRRRRERSEETAETEEPVDTEHSEAEPEPEPEAEPDPEPPGPPPAITEHGLGIAPFETVLWAPPDGEPTTPSEPGEEQDATIPESDDEAPPPRRRLRIGRRRRERSEDTADIEVAESEDGPEDGEPEAEPEPTPEPEPEPEPPRPPPPAVAGHELVKRYGVGDAEVQALRGVTVSIESGTFTAIMGPSGSGKSTLMHILAGLDDPTEGRVEIAGRALDTLSDRELTLLRRDQVGFVFQSFNLLPVLNVEENLRLPLSIAGVTPDPEWIDTLLDAVGLTDRRKHRPSQLSGGQQQRVAVARALVTRPAVVFADEPTGNLDSAAGGEVLDLLRRAVDDFDQTIVLVTHEATAAARADRVLFLEDGRVARDAGRLAADAILDALKRH